MEVMILTLNIDDYSFEKIFNRKDIKYSTKQIKKYMSDLKDKTFVVAGVGSIGGNLAKRLAYFGCGWIDIFDISENNLCEVVDYFKTIGFENYSSKLLDLKDPNFIPTVDCFSKPYYDYVINTSAYKHVIFCENNHNLCYENNTQIVENLLKISCGKHIFLSTDKAVYPTSVMGKSKRLCELLYLKDKPKSKIIRFGNVWGSSGSLLPRILKNIENGTIEITDKNAKRWFISLEMATKFIMDTSLYSDKTINVLNMGKQENIMNIVNKIVKISGKEVNIKYIGLTSGEKITEELYYENKIPLMTFSNILSKYTEKYELFKDMAYLELDVME